MNSHHGDTEARRTAIRVLFKGPGSRCYISTDAPKFEVFHKKWIGKHILIGPPRPPEFYVPCETDLVWPILEPEMVADNISLGGGSAPVICRHMFEGAD